MNDKFKKFLKDGFQVPGKEGETEPDTEEGQPTEPEEQAPVPEEEPADDGFTPDVGDALKNINDELLKMRYILEDLRTAEPAAEAPDLDKYLTNREQLRAVKEAVEHRDSDISNKNLVRAMEQISVMREDFFKLCKGMRERIDRMSAEDVLSSFEAYEVDMENILTDGGVRIGPSPYDSLNTIHQRIVDVVPTDDEELDGKVAERLTDGYEMGTKVLLKEKVKIYKFTKSDKPAEPADTAEEETVSETVSAGSEAEAADPQEETE